MAFQSSFPNTARFLLPLQSLKIQHKHDGSPSWWVAWCTASIGRVVGVSGTSATLKSMRLVILKKMLYLQYVIDLAWSNLGQQSGQGATPPSTTLSAGEAVKGWIREQCWEIAYFRHHCTRPYSDSGGEKKVPGHLLHPSKVSKCCLFQCRHQHSPTCCLFRC